MIILHQIVNEKKILSMHRDSNPRAFVLLLLAKDLQLSDVPLMLLGDLAEVTKTTAIVTSSLLRANPYIRTELPILHSQSCIT